MLRQTRTGCEKVDEPANVLFVFLPDFLAGGVIAVRVGVIGADEIRRKSTVVVNVRFPDGHPERIPKLVERRFASASHHGFHVPGK